VQAYLNGHDHDLQHRRRAVNLFCSGAGSKPRKPKEHRPIEFAQGCSASCHDLQAEKLSVQAMTTREA